MCDRRQQLAVLLECMHINLISKKYKRILIALQIYGANHAKRHEHDGRMNLVRRKCVFEFPIMSSHND